MRQTGRRTADTVLNIVESVKEPSRMLQQVTIVISEQKTVNTILMNLQPIQSAIAPSSVEDFIAIRSPSGTTHFRCGARRAPENRKRKNCVRKEEKQKRKVSHPAEKSKT